MSESQISVVIPTYNGARYIGDALASALAQTAPPCEIVVVDDYSTDDTAAVVEKIAAGASVVVRLLRLPANSGGPARPINVGIEAARGQYIGVLDQDDAYAPDILARAAAALDATPQCSVACWWSGDLDDRLRNDVKPCEWRRSVQELGVPRHGFVEVPGETFLALLVEKLNFLVGYPGFVFRREHWKFKGGVDETLRIASDVELLGWLFQRGSAAMIPTIGYWRRLHEHNVTRRTAEMYSEAAVVIVRLLQTAAYLQGDAALRSQAIRWLYGLAYWFRRGHRFHESARVQGLLAELGEPATARWKESAKLKLHSACARILRFAPCPSPFVEAPGARRIP